MRWGDCCLLKWKGVDLNAGFITVKTAKTGQTVDIPVFPMLREELERAQQRKGESAFCFPEAAEMYRTNPDGITWRVKPVLAKALEAGRDSSALPVEKAETVRAKGLESLKPGSCCDQVKFSAFSFAGFKDSIERGARTERGERNEAPKIHGCSSV